MSPDARARETTGRGMTAHTSATHATTFGARLRQRRHHHGLTQAQLADRAGVSRQLIASVETERHLPRADAAAALARALATTVEVLLAPPPAEPTGVTTAPRDGDHVRLAHVGDHLVCHVAPPEHESWTPADGVIRDGRVALLDEVPPAAVIAGCDPAIGLAGRLLESAGGPAVIAAPASTAAAVSALSAGRAHAAIAHGPVDDRPEPPIAVHRIEVARWQVGLVAPAGLAATWVDDALHGRVDVIQREPGATAQAAFERARATSGASDLRAADPGGHDHLDDRLVASGHLDAAARARDGGLVAVSIEPAALAAGLAFHPLEEHVCELWIALAHLRVPAVQRFADELTGARLHRRLAGIGGYDLSGCGREATA